MRYFRACIIKFLRLFVAIWKSISYPLLGARCRFYPSCSTYFLEAVEEHGLLKGGWLGIKRLSKCHPFYQSNSDRVD